MKKFKVGIAQINIQHEYFALLINKLIDELEYSYDSYYHRNRLKELSDNIIFFKLSRKRKVDLLRYVIDWFIIHTIEQDRAFGSFATQKNDQQT